MTDKCNLHFTSILTRIMSPQIVANVIKKIPLFWMHLLDIENSSTIFYFKQQALGDILVLEKSFNKMSKNIEPTALGDKIIEISSKPVLLTRMYFGKHKSQMFKNIPQDYLKWLSGTEMDEDMRFTVGHYLN